MVDLRSIDNQIEVLSVPHTVLAESQALDPNGQKGAASEFRHVLTRGMGVADSVKPDISEVKVYKDDVLVIGSDGLSDKMLPEEIRDIVVIRKPERACRFLVDLANERGGDDDITVIVLKIKRFIDSNSRLWKTR